MAAIVRVKRRRSEDPAESLLLSCKKARSTEVDHGSKNPEHVFRFAGTVSEKEAHYISRHIRDAIRREKRQREYKHPNVRVDVKSEARQSRKAAAANQRYQLISQKRALDLDGLDQDNLPQDNRVQEAIAASASGDKRKIGEENGDKASGEDLDGRKLYCLYDVVQEEENSPRKKTKTTVLPETITCNGVAMVREHVSSAEEEYVYDLYYSNSGQLDFRELENVLAIEALQHDLELVDDRHREEEDVYDDDDDSNDEDNWRNDYPDEYNGDVDSDNEEEDIGYGYDHDYAKAFDSDEEYGLTSRLGYGLQIVGEDNDGGDAKDASQPSQDINKDSGQSESSDDDHRHGEGLDWPSQRHTALAPHRSYERYKAHVEKELKNP